MTEGSGRCPAVPVVPVVPVVLDEETRGAPQRIASSAKAQVRQVLGARIVLAAAGGAGNAGIARRLAVGVNTVRKWRGRFAGRGLEGLKDAVRSGRPRRYDDLVRVAVVAAATGIPPAPAATWTHTAIAAQVAGSVFASISASQVGRILAGLDLKPHKVRGWLTRRDTPDFWDRVQDVCALYRTQPKGAIVLAIDVRGLRSRPASDATPHTPPVPQTDPPRHRARCRAGSHTDRLRRLRSRSPERGPDRRRARQADHADLLDLGAQPQADRRQVRGAPPQDQGQRGQRGPGTRRVHEAPDRHQGRHRRPRHRPGRVLRAAGNGTVEGSGEPRRLQRPVPQGQVHRLRLVAGHHQRRGLRRPPGHRSADHVLPHRRLQEAQAAAPKTWKEFADDAAKIHAADPTHYITSIDPGDAGGVDSLIWQAGGKPFQTSGSSKVSINLKDAGATKVSTLWTSLLSKHLVDPTAGWTNEWWQGMSSGKYAMWIAGAWGAGPIAATIPQTAGKWAAAPVPQWEAGGTASAENGGSSNAVPVTSKNKAAAVAFAEWLNSDPAATKALSDVGLFPATTALLKDPAFLNKKIAILGGQQANQVYAGSSAQVNPGWQYLPFQVYANSVFKDTAGQAVSGRTDLSAGLTAWQKRIADYGNRQGFTVTGG